MQEKLYAPASMTPQNEPGKANFHNSQPFRHLYTKPYYLHFLGPVQSHLVNTHTQPHTHPYFKWRLQMANGNA